MYPGLPGIDVCDLSLTDLDRHLPRAVGAGIFEPERKIVVIAAFVAGDHQQKVDRSPNAEGLAVADGNGVVVVPKGSPPTPVLPYELVADGAFRCLLEKTGITQEAQSIS